MRWNQFTRRRPVRPTRPRPGRFTRAVPFLERLEDRTPPSALLSLFELDGNATTGVLASPPGANGTSTTTSHDWDQVFADDGSPTASPGSGTVTNGPTSLALAGTFVNDLFNSSSDNTYSSGSANSGGIQSWHWTTAAANPSKNDIVNIFADSYLDTDPTSPTFGHVFLYTGMDRFDNSGAATAGFWFFQNPIATIGSTGGTFSGMHSTGDLFVGAAFTQGGSVATPTVYQWVGNDATGMPVQITPPTGTTFAIVNSAPISVPWSFTNKSGATSPAAGEFLEVGVDLTAMGLNQGCFTSFLANTASSPSITSALTDFALGSFSSC